MRAGMKLYGWSGFVMAALLLAWSQSDAQEKLKISYSSVDAPNANWYIAEDKRLYQKYGLDAELIFIPTSTTNVATLVAGSVKAANISGGSIANGVVGGAALVAVGCFINTLPYELIVHESIRSAQQLKGKSVGISRIGSSSDVAARVLLKGLGLEPDKDVAVLQVGGSGERAAAFASGKIVAFPSPPGTIHLTKGMASRTLITTADFPKSYPFPYVCPTSQKSYLSTNRDTVKRLLMALIEGTYFFKTRKEESKRFLPSILANRTRPIWKALTRPSPSFSSVCPWRRAKAWRCRSMKRSRWRASPALA